MPYRLTQQGLRRRADRRGAILAAARALFETQGYHATTMQQVVRAAGTSIGNAYFYFPHKEALLSALVDQTVADIQATIDAAVEGLAPGPEYAAVSLYAGVVAALERAPIVRVWLTEAGLPELRTRALGHFVARARLFLTLAPDILHGMDPDMAAQAWQGSTFHVVEAVIAGALPNNPDELGTFVARWTLQALGLPPADVEQALAALRDRSRPG
jgi:AcrR family transcriptional regulator